MISTCTACLPALSRADRMLIASLPRTIAAHDAHMAGLACMNMVEVGGQVADAPLALPLTVAA